ncbi:MAG: LuxR C-terminal-related transcriptional regulator [Thermomicrobiales bacterium]
MSLDPRDQPSSVVAFSPAVDRIPARFLLPRPLAPFVGRSHEREQLRPLVLDPELRLLTLTGPGGVGKTRLAIEVVSEIQDHLLSTVRFVSLGSLAHPDQILGAIATMLDASDGGAIPLIESISAAIQDLPTLLILDNVEHLLPEAAIIVGELLSQCPTLRIVATSRAPLRVYGEQRHPVSPLSLPDPGRADTRDPAGSSDAARLFVERMQSHDPHLVLTPQDLATIAQICIRLDGLPLALELAAARAVDIGPAAYLQRIEQDAPLPSGDARDLPARQHTVAATVAWSYDLLGPHQQWMFRLLSVFSGPFTLGAVEALGQAIAPYVAHDRNNDRVPAALLIDLVDSSLVQRLPQKDGETEFRLLETVRQEARWLLARSGDESVARRAHAHHFLDVCKTAQLHLITGRDIITWLEFIESRLADVLAAMDWAETNDLSMLVAFNRRLFPFWFRRSRIREALTWYSLPLVRRDELSDADLGWALANFARMRHFLPGESAATAMMYEEVLAIAERLRDDELRLTLCVSGTMLALRDRDPHSARQWYARALSVPDVWSVCERVTIPAFLAGLEGSVAAVEGRFDEAVRIARICLAKATLEDDEASIGFLYLVLATAAHATGDVVRARTSWVSAINAFDHFGERWNVAEYLISIASLLNRGHPELALRLGGAAQRLQQIHGIAAVTIADEPFCSATAALSPSEPSAVDLWRTGATTPWRTALGEAIVCPLDRPTRRKEGDRVAEFPSGPGGTLSRREFAVLRLVAEGLTDQEIAAELGVSYRTVTTYVGRILAKLGVPSRAAASSRVAKQGYLSD